MQTVDHVLFYDTAIVNGEKHSLRFDYGHYRKVRDAKNGCNRHQTLIDSHPLVGKRFTDAGGNECIVTSVHKHWFFGFYEYVIYIFTGTKSHGTLFGNNISSRDTAIMHKCDEFKRLKFSD
jgi:hypothetical protein